MTGPNSILTQAIISHVNEDGSSKSVANGTLITRLGIIIDTPVNIVDSIDEHNAEVYDLPTRITWETTLMSSSNAYLALLALQTDKEYFNFILQPINADPKANMDKGLPMMLIDCKATRFERANLSDDIVVVTYRGIARRFTANPPGRTAVSGGSDIPDDEVFDLSNYATVQ